MHSRLAPAACRGESLGSEDVATQLRAITSSSLSSTETIVRLRAAQAAYFVDGVLVELTDVRRLGPVDVVDIGLSHRAASKLRRLVNPVWACALVLADVGGLGSVDLARLNIDDFDPDGRCFTVGRRQYEVPGYAAALVRAQLLDRTDKVRVPGHHRRGEGPGRRTGSRRCGPATWPRPPPPRLRANDRAGRLLLGAQPPLVAVGPVGRGPGEGATVLTSPLRTR